MRVLYFPFDETMLIASCSAPVASPLAVSITLSF